MQLWRCVAKKPLVVGKNALTAQATLCGCILPESTCCFDLKTKPKTQPLFSSPTASVFCHALRLSLTLQPLSSLHSSISLFLALSASLLSLLCLMLSPSLRLSQPLLSLLPLSLSNCPPSLPLPPSSAAALLHLSLLPCFSFFLHCRKFESYP